MGQSEESLGNVVEVDSNVNYIFREKLSHSVGSYPSSRVSTSLTERLGGKGSKSGFRKIKSTVGYSSVTGSLPASLEVQTSKNDFIQDQEPEMLTRIDVQAAGTDIASKLTHLMSGNNAFNANILVKNVNQEIVHRADPGLVSSPKYS